MIAKKKDKKQRVILLDSHAILHRAFHALPDFATASGKPTGALYGLITMILKIMDDLKPDYLIATRDLPGGTFRNTLFADYKGTRPDLDPALIDQLNLAPKIFEAFNIPVYGVAGYEADDLLGTIVNQLKSRKDIEIIIASGDMDTLQLVEGERVRVYTLRQGITDTVLYDSLRVYERYGFGPHNLIDYKGLRGDPSDNIKGIAGIGEKTATQLITEFGSIDDIYDALKKHPEKFEEVGVKKRIVGLLRDGEKEARLSRELATIHPEVPIVFALPEKPWNIHDATSTIEAMCDEYEFRSLKERLRSRLQFAPAPAQEEVVHEDVDDMQLCETSIALWLLKSDITNPSLDDVLTFADTRSFSAARTFIFEKINSTGRLRDVYEKIEQPLLSVVKRMNTSGVCIDKKTLEGLAKEYGKELGEIAGRIFQHAGHEFNIQSTRQLATVLYDELKLTPEKQKKTATGLRTTREDELAKISDQHPIIEEILSYRELQKLLSTYVEKMIELIDKDGRLRAEFLQTGTTTGRMGCQNPNLQNIPIRTEYGRRIRGAFTAAKGSSLIALDYSQIELRIAAGLSGDTKLVQIFTEGRDIHTAVASEVFGVKPEDVDREMRRRAKIINFGILYGMGVNALRASLGKGVTREEASKYIEEYFAGYAGLATWIETIKNDASRLGYTETIFGRRRYFQGFKSSLPMMRSQAERMAVNAPIQGTQADIIKLAMVKADQLIEVRGLRDKVKLVLQVHDELVYEIENSIAHEIAQDIRLVMESIITDNSLSGVPILVDAAIGENWGQTEKLARNV